MASSGISSLRNSPNVQMAPLSLVAHCYSSSKFGGIPILARRARPAAAKACVSSELASSGAAVQNPEGGADHHGSSDHPDAVAAIALPVHLSSAAA